MKPKRTRIGIIGGGISGLTTAFYLRRGIRERRVNAEISLLEQSERLGGVIRSERRGDFLLEAGPEGFASHKPSVLALIKDLDLSGDLIGSNDHRRRTFLLSEGRLREFPDGMMFLAPVRLGSFWRTAPLTRRGRLRAMMEPFVRHSKGDPSIEDFLRRRLGPEFTAKLGRPLVSAIYGGDASRLSARAAMGDFYRLEQRFGSLYRGMRRLNRLRGKQAARPSYLTLSGGMQQLVQRIEQRLHGDVKIQRGLQGLRLKTSARPLRVRARGFEEAFDFLVLSTPAYASAAILQEALPEAARHLAGVPYSTSRLVYLAYSRDRFSHPLDGFGFIVHPEESFAMDACTWVSRKFDQRCPRDAVLVRAAIHERRLADLPGSDEGLAARVDQELKRVMGYSAAPLFHRVYRVRRGMPQLVVGHPERMKRVGEALEGTPGLHLSGAFLAGVGIPECIRTAKETAEKLLGDEQKR